MGSGGQQLSQCYEALHLTSEEEMLEGELMCSYVYIYTKEATKSNIHMIFAYMNDEHRNTPSV